MDNALMYAHSTFIIKIFLVAIRHYITHNPPARRGDIIHGGSQPKPVFCFEVAGSQRSRIPRKRCRPARTGIRDVFKVIISK